MIRWLGRKHLTQMSIFEYISGIVLGGAVAIHMSSLEYPFFHGIVAIVTWTTLVVSVDTIALKSKRIHDFIHGKSKVIIRDGSFIDEHLREERLTTNELLDHLRMRNIHHMSDVKIALLEPSGDIHIQVYDNEHDNHQLKKPETVQLLNQLLSNIQKDQSNMNHNVEEGTVHQWIDLLNEIKHTYTQSTSHHDKS